MKNINTTIPAARSFKERHAANLQELATKLWLENRELKKEIAKLSEVSSRTPLTATAK
tara:strand:+ start:610 stop:783 length:174 start_codon:yes stop_codon:yes gene_type:complete